MKQTWRLLFVGFLAASWMSLKLVQCSKSAREIHSSSLCYNTSSGRTCFTTFFTNLQLPVRMSFENARDWCKAEVPGSSLVVIKSAEDQHIVESFIGTHALGNETIITDGRKLSASERWKWSWVNGHQTIPSVVARSRLTAAALNSQQKSSAYSPDNAWLKRRYICEYSDSESTYHYKQNNKSYVPSNKTATWYDARKECLRLGGDLASITNLETIGNWSWLSTNGEYWIGLHRNKWIWNRTGDAITYTNWEGGYPNETPNIRCICINPRCKLKDNRTFCEKDWKWRTCNCNLNYAIVCQKQEDSDVLPTEIVVPEEILPSGEIDRKTASSSSVTQNPSDHFPENQITAFATSSTGLNRKQSLLILLPFVAVAFIVAAVILAIRNCKHDRRNERAYMQNTTQSEAVSSLYTTVVPVNNRPSEGTVPPGNPIYAEVEMTKQPTPPANNTIYASVQPTIEEVDMGKSVVYADLSFPQKY